MTKHDKQPRVKVNFRIKKEVVQQAEAFAEDLEISVARFAEQAMEEKINALTNAPTK